MNYTEDKKYPLRDDQKRTVEYILSAYERGRTAVICVAPTGSGKSIIARAVASAFPTSYLLTPMKILQDQYGRDFAHDPQVKVLKGKATYRCFYESPAQADFLDGEENEDDIVMVDKAKCWGSGGISRRKSCRDEGICAYYGALSEASNARCAVMSFVGYLVWRTVSKAMNESGAEGPFDQRHLHVVDECHAVDRVLRDFLGVQEKIKTLREKFYGVVEARKVIDQLMTADEPTAVGLIRKTNGWASTMLDFISEQYNINSTPDDRTNLLIEMEDNRQLKKEAEWYLNYEKKTRYMMRVLEVAPDEYALGVQSSFREEDATLVAKPLNVGGFARQMVHGERSLFLSATIPDAHTWAAEMGLKQGEYHVINMDSRFPAKNRPVFMMNIGSISQTTKMDIMPRAFDVIARLLRRYTGEKGLIHTPSFEWTEALEKHLANNPQSNRLLYAKRGLVNNAKLLEMHSSSELPTVLVSPSMKEGVDLKDDLCRWQVIIKAPFESLGDPVVAKKCLRSSRWYDMITLGSFMQQVGRSVRHENDHAHTYVLDTKMGVLLKKREGLLPQYFTQAIHHDYKLS